MAENEFNFGKVVAKLQEQKFNLPIKLATLAENYFASTFRKGGFDGKSWAEVKRREKPAPKSDKSATRRGILIGKTRRLMDSIRHSIREVSWEEIKLGTDVPYAVYHNEGTDKLPQRQFMGNSAELNEKVTEKLKEAMHSIFKK